MLSESDVPPAHAKDATTNGKIINGLVVVAGEVLKQEDKSLELNDVQRLDSFVS